MKPSGNNILLVAINARYTHSSFGLRYLRANMRELRAQTQIKEFTINQNVTEIWEQILPTVPQVIGIGVYVWNATQVLQLVRLIKSTRPETLIILGGPEVSYEWDQQEVVKWADYVICGEADLAFYELCRNWQQNTLPSNKIIAAPKPDVAQLALPYGEYSDDDVKNRIIYVEASRGCVFKCEFCLSSLEKSVRQFPLEAFLAEMKILLDRGVRIFKFIDRTFNLNIKITLQIVQFFWTHYKPGIFLHFEMVPDRLPPELRQLIALFPPGALQFEVGIQSFNPEITQLISRRQDLVKLRENLTFLKDHTSVHVHADLIVGLPGEDIFSFAHGFDTLARMGSQEIQVGILKRLRGTPIIRHEQKFALKYDFQPPYEIMQTQHIDFSQMQQLKRFARYWDIIANSGQFPQSVLQIMRLAEPEQSPFWNFWEFSNWLYQKTNLTFGLALEKLCENIFIFLRDVRQVPQEEVAALLIADYGLNGKRKMPALLRPFEIASQTHNKTAQISSSKNSSILLDRQQRHVEHAH